MNVPDLNVLLYAVDSRAAHHAIARTWWDDNLSSGSLTGLAWSVVIGFIRISTNPRIYKNPLSAEEACAHVTSWQALASVVMLEPSDRHMLILKELLSKTGAAGNLVSDAHLAALAIETGATLYSFDSDFQRFPGLRWSRLA